MDPETPKEVAKAVQETAKTTKAAIEKLGPWFGRVIGEPTGLLADTLVDQLKFYRAKRAVLLNERWVAFMLEHGITEPRPIPPKFAIPIIENASLEDDDVLFDLWTNLLISGSDPSQVGGIRAAFIEIIKGMDPLDAKVLNEIHQSLAPEGKLQNMFIVVTRRLIKHIQQNWSEEISEQEIRVSIENLLRLRCIAPYFQDKELAIPNVHTRRTHVELVSLGYGSDRLILTPLGVAFVEACISRPLVESA